MKIRGYCPMGCGETLFTAPEGAGTSTIQCFHPECPAPDATSRILADPETEHVAHLYEDHFNLKHPLRERLDDGLLHCACGDFLHENERPEEPGVYRVTEYRTDPVSENRRSGFVHYRFEAIG